MRETIDPLHLAAELDAFAQLPLERRFYAGLQHGEFPSKRRGHGAEDDGVRVYQPGDDFRQISATLSARQPNGELMVRRQFRDVAPAVSVVTDMMNGQFANRLMGDVQSKQLLAARVGVMMMLLAQRESMPAGAVVGNGDYVALVRPSRDPRVLDQYIDEVAAFGADDAETPPPVAKKRGWLRRSPAPSAEQPVVRSGQLQELTLQASRMLTRGSVAVVMSDFRADDPEHPTTGWLEGMEELAGRRKVVAVELTSPWDFAIPATVDHIELQNGQRLSIEQYPDFRREYRAKALAKQQKIHAAFAAVDAAHVQLSTADPEWIDSLADQLHDLV